MNRYDYDQRTLAEIDHIARLAIPNGCRLRRASLPEDYAGTDVHYQINATVPLAIRVRHNRPAYAADIDVTFRATEPTKIAAGTYAPLALFIWMHGGFAVAGKLVDIYQLHRKADPPLIGRRTRSNGDGTAWLPVEISELVKTSALLRQGDGREWAAAALGGTERTLRIISKAAS